MISRRVALQEEDSVAEKVEKQLKGKHNPKAN